MGVLYPAIKLTHVLSNKQQCDKLFTIVINRGGEAFYQGIIFSCTDVLVTFILRSSQPSIWIKSLWDRKSPTSLNFKGIFKNVTNW